MPSSVEMVIRSLSKELQLKAAKELNEVVNRIPDDLEIIRQWMSKQNHINSRLDDQWLLNFLRGCKFSIERTKEKLDNFYTLRSLLPEFYENRDPFLKEIQVILSAGVILPLPKTVEGSGPKIIILDWGKAKPATMSALNLTKVFYMLLDILLLEDDNFVISGLFLWLEYTNFPLGYLMQMTPPLVKKSITCMQNCYPGRISGLHATSVPPLCESFFNLMKSFASNKIKKRMSMHRAIDSESFREFLPQKYMPLEMGGQNGSIPDLTEYWKRKIESYRDWYFEDEQYRANEKLRPSKPKTSAEIFGVEGAFRKLDLD